MEFTKSTFMFPLLLVLNGCFRVYAEPLVEIVDFGMFDLELEIGKPVQFTCEVTDPVAGGDIIWKIGDRIIQNTNGVKTVDYDGDYDIIENNLEFIPEKKDDGQPLSCIHTMDGEEYESDPITVNTFVVVVDPIVPVTVVEGDPVTITVTANIYPPPASDDITWEITDQTIVGDDIVLLKPGEDKKGYSASNMKKVPDLEDKYSFSLSARSVDETDINKDLNIIIKSKKMKRKVDMSGSISIKKLVSTTTATSSTTTTEMENQKSQTSVNMMGGSWIIIVIIVLLIVIMIFICCFCYRKNKKSEKNVRNDNKIYIPVSTTTTTNSTKQNDIEVGEQV